MSRREEDFFELHQLYQDELTPYQLRLQFHVVASKSGQPMYGCSIFSGLDIAGACGDRELDRVYDYVDEYLEKLRTEG